MDRREAGCGLDPSGSGQCSVVGHCEYGNEPLDSDLQQQPEWIVQYEVVVTHFIVNYESHTLK
jgi:hypothetical protein